MTSNEDRKDTDAPDTSSRASTRSGHDEDGEDAAQASVDVMGGPNQSPPGDQVMGGPNQPPPGGDVMAPHGGEEERHA